MCALATWDCCLGLFVLEELRAVAAAAVAFVLELAAVDGDLLQVRVNSVEQKGNGVVGLPAGFPG